MLIRFTFSFIVSYEEKMFAMSMETTLVVVWEQVNSKLEFERTM